MAASDSSRAYGWRRTAAPWLLLVVSVLGMTYGASRRTALVVAASLVGLLASTSWLHSRIRDEQRKPGADPGRRRRVVVAAIALVIGVALIAVLGRFLGGGMAWFFFVGLTLVLLGGGMLVSEWRQGQGERGPWTTRLLFTISVGLLLGALLQPAQWIALAGALLLAELATELVSERSHRWHWRRKAEDELSAVSARHRRCVSAQLVAGAAVIAVGFGVIVQGGARFDHAVLLLLVVAVLVVLAAADSDALVVTIIGAFLLLWATAPRSEPIPDASVATAGQPYFVVLGDSYISGEGADVFLEGTNTTSRDGQFGPTRENECRRSTTSWPLLLAGHAPEGDQDVDVPERVLFIACSGAVTENIHTEPREDERRAHGPAELQLLAERSEGLGLPAFVVLSIGGNDAGFGEIGRTCVGPGDCIEIGQQFLNDPRRRDDPQPTNGPPGAGMPESVASIADDLDAAYERVAAAVADGVPIVVVPYPTPITNGGECELLLTEAERRFVNGYVDELNLVIEAAAARHGFLYLEAMESALRDADSLLCAESGAEAGLNFIKLNPTAGSIRDSLMPTNWTHNSLHPNADGHRAMAAAARRWFADHLPLDTPEPDPDSSYEVRSLTEVMDREIEQCGMSSDCGISDNRWIAGRAHDLYRRALLPVSLLAVGTWLLLMPALWWCRANEIGIARLAFWRRRQPDNGRDRSNEASSTPSGR